MPTHYQGTAAERRALDAYIKLIRGASALGARMERRLLGLGLTESQFGVLEILYHLGPSYQRDLGAKLLTSGGNITMVVDNLERRGLVRRERDADDRRHVAVHLTAEGRDLIRRMLPDHIRAIVEALAVLSPEDQDTLGRLCKAVGLQAAPAPAGPRPAADAAGRPRGGPARRARRRPAAEPTRASTPSASGPAAPTR